MTVRVKFKANRAGITRACRSEDIYRNLEHRTEQVRLVARGLAAPHRKTGEYDRSFVKTRFLTRGVAGVRLTNTAGHALILERGSRPHIIEPSTKKALAWPGGLHPVRRVHHPGTPALHIMRNALRAAGRL